MLFRSYCAFPDPSSPPAVKGEFCLDSLGVLRAGNPSSAPRECDQNSIFLFRRKAEALSACPLGMRLPTVQEMAVLSESWGAQIWRSKSGAIVRPPVEEGKRPIGYNEILIRNSNGGELGFYYSRENYKAPSAEWLPDPDYFDGRLLLWTSSSHLTEDPENTFFLDAKSGHLLSTQYHGAVMCVPDKH